MYFQWRRGRGGSRSFTAPSSSTAASRVRACSARSPSWARSSTASASTSSAHHAGASGGPVRLEQLVGDRCGGGPHPRQAVCRDGTALVSRTLAAQCAVDVVFSDSDLTGYDVVIAPMLHMVKPGLADQFRRWSNVAAPSWPACSAAWSTRPTWPSRAIPARSCWASGSRRSTRCTRTNQPHRDGRRQRQLRLRRLCEVVQRNGRGAGQLRQRLLRWHARGDPQPVRRGRRLLRRQRSRRPLSG